MVGKPEGKGPLGKPRSRWEDNIKMNLQEVGCGSMEWTVQALVNVAMNLRFPLNSENSLTS